MIFGMILYKMVFTIASLKRRFVSIVQLGCMSWFFAARLHLSPGVRYLWQNWRWWTMNTWNRRKTIGKGTKYEYGPTEMGVAHFIIRFNGISLGFPITNHSFSGAVPPFLETPIWPICMFIGIFDWSWFFGSCLARWFHCPGGPGLGCFQKNSYKNLHLQRLPSGNLT